MDVTTLEIDLNLPWISGS